MPSLVLSVQGWSYNQLVMYNFTCVMQRIYCPVCASTVGKAVQEPNYQQQCDDIGGGVPTLGTPNSSCS